MGSKHLSADINYAWENSEISVMGVEGVVEIIFRKEAKTPEQKAKKALSLKDTLTSPFIAASRGYIDDIIKPQNTRWRIAKALNMLKNKQETKPWKKHDNLPL